MKHILVTCALPYANGSIHLGHILEHIQADIWVKFNKMLGNKVYFICADDSHGTAVYLKAKSLQINPKNMIKNILVEHINQFINFNIFHNYYSTTHSKYNYIFLKKFINRCQKKNILYTKSVLQFYDNTKKIFLPDRYIEGTCPICNSINQYGDSCFICGSIYNSIDLINPISRLSSTIPNLMYSDHLFINLNIFKNNLIYWINEYNLNKNVLNQLLIWLKNDLIDWNISRDFPYFGFKIPSKYIYNKYFYVWCDALLGYISTFYKYCKYKKSINLFSNFWDINSNYELYHFIGKDILYFHGILWPIILNILNYRQPTGLVVHGHIMINGIKMSKSLNNYINTNNWLQYFDADSLRYYLASLLNNSIKDINISLNDLVNKINSDIVNKFINIASRISGFLYKYFNNILSKLLWDDNIYNYFVNKSIIIYNLYLKFNYNKIIIEINLLLDIINKYINDHSPWILNTIGSKLKNINNLHMFCTTIINIFKVLSIYLNPIIPNIISKVKIFLNIKKLSWNDLYKPLLNHKIKKYINIYNRLNILNINKIL